MITYILVIITTSVTFSSPGSSSYEYRNQAITMQEFSDQKSCVAAHDIIKRRAGEAASKFNIFCIPK